jgi:hypothetical protein
VKLQPLLNLNDWLASLGYSFASSGIYFLGETDKVAPATDSLCVGGTFVGTALIVFFAGWSEYHRTESDERFQLAVRRSTVIESTTC